GKVLRTFWGHTDLIHAVAFSPDGRRIATGSVDKTASILEIANGRWVILKGHSAEVAEVVFSPHGRRIITGGVDQTTKVWETDSGNELLTLKGHGVRIRSVAFSQDGERIATGGWDAPVNVWEAATAQQVTNWQREEQEARLLLDARKAQQTAEDEHERAVRLQDRGAIKQWLLLLPISVRHGDGAE